MAGVSGNNVVENQGLNPLVSYNYMLRVEGVFDLPCKSVHSFTKENEYDFIQEGGLNDYVHMRRKPVTKPFTFTVERYVGIDYYDPLQNGSDLILPVILLVTRHANRFDVTKRAYVFTGCTVMSKEYGELNAEQSGLLTETTVIGYREMLVVNASDKEIGRWNFDGVHAEGSGTRFAQTYEPIPPADLIEDGQAKNQPSLWEFDERKPEGNGNRRAAKDVSKPAGKPRLWEFAGDKPEGNGTRSARIYTPPESENAEGETGEGSTKPEAWKFDQKKPEGNGNRHAAKDVSTKAEKSQAWEFDQKKPEGNGSRHVAKDVSTDAEESRLWEFAEGKPEGKGTRSARIYTPPESENAEGETGEGSTKPEAWKFDQKKPEGNGNRHAAKDVSTKAEKSQAWEFDQKKPEGNGNRHAAKDVSTKAAESQAWEFAQKDPEGNGNRHAVKDVSTEAEDSRLWELDEQKAEGKGTRSARTYTPPEAKAVGRRWPPVASAKKYAAGKAEPPGGDEA